MKTVLATVFVLIILVIVIWAYGFFGPGGALDQKAIYAEMQGVEFHYRAKHITIPFVLKTANGLRLVGLETSDKQFPYVWIALELDDAEAIDGVFQVGSAPPSMLSCAQVRELLAKEKTSKNVATLLMQQCAAR